MCWLQCWDYPLGFLLSMISWNYPQSSTRWQVTASTKDETASVSCRYATISSYSAWIRWSAHSYHPYAAGNGVRQLLSSHRHCHSRLVQCMSIRYLANHFHARGHLTILVRDKNHVVKRKRQDPRVSHEPDYRPLIIPPIRCTFTIDASVVKKDCSRLFLYVLAHC